MIKLLVKMCNFHNAYITKILYKLLTTCEEETIFSRFSRNSVAFDSEFLENLPPPQLCHQQGQILKYTLVYNLSNNITVLDLSHFKYRSVYTTHPIIVHIHTLE